MSLQHELDSKRLCWKCEGSVSIHIAQCPYCNAFLQDPPTPGNSFSSCHLSVEDSQDTLAKGESSEYFSMTSSDWDSVLSDHQHKDFSVYSEEQKERGAIAEPQEVAWQAVLPYIILFSGMGLTLFSLLILLGETGGSLTLSWSKKTAFYYAMAGVPFLYKGMSSLR